LELGVVAARSLDLRLDAALEVLQEGIVGGR
jgi:hypothetical protein